MIEKELHDLILRGIENDQIDFKEKYYQDEKKYDIIKDIVSFANNPKCNDKYIVFGVENNGKSVSGIKKGSLPDISQINDLLRTYVEPFLDIEIGEYEFLGKTVGYIYIPHMSLNRPYLISKDYERKGTTFLRKGNIYIRKGATNFVACRCDLDEIYDNKGSLEVSFYQPNEIIFSFLRIGNSDVLMGQIRCVLNNTSSLSFVVDKIDISVNTGSNLIDYTALFLEDQKKHFDKQPQELLIVPQNVKSGDRVQKTIYFKASEQSVLNIYRKTGEGRNILSKIMIHDVTDKKYESDLSSVKIIFGQELIKYWEKCE